MSRQSVAGVALGAALAAVAFAAKGGTELARTTAVEIALLVAAGVTVAVAIAYAPRPPRQYGALSLALLAAVAAFTALSILWSVAPWLSWVEANRTFAYLAVFAAGVALARLAPRQGSEVLLRAVLVAAAIVVGYALASRVWPETLAEHEVYARIGQPFGYWNAVGVTAALSLPAALWLGARRSGDSRFSVLSYPLTGMLALALVLSYSRGSLAAAAVALAVWFAAVPLRLRSLTVLAVAGAAATPVVLWALSKDAFTEDGVPLPVREDVAAGFGALVVAMLAALLVAGLAISRRVASRPPSEEARRRAGTVAVAALCALPLIALGAATFSERGVGGTISDRVEQLTSESRSATGGPERLTQSASSRGRYWREAGRIFAEHRAVGAGAGTFGIARLRFRKSELVARHAHGYVAQTLADLGLAGLALALALAAAWLGAAVRATGIRPLAGRLGRPPGEPRAWDSERVAVTALALCALAFGVHSALDWTWFVPGPAVTALLAAGFVAGRGQAGAAGEEPEPEHEPTAEPPPSPDAAPLAGRPSRARLAAAGAVLAATALLAWTAWQPQRSDRESSHALQLVDAGRPAEAVEAAERAGEIDPLSPRPLLVEATARAAAGRPQEALDALERAVEAHPRSPQVWLRLADFQLHGLGRPRAALETLRGAVYLDPNSREARRLFLEARARTRDGGN